jgi:hypothetical protein
MRRNVLVALLPLLLATPVHADDEAIEAAKKSIDVATRLTNDGCLGAAKTALAEAEAKVKALGDFEGERVKSELDRAKQHLDGRLKSWTAEEAGKAANDHVYGVKESVKQIETALFPGTTDKRYDDANARLDRFLADEVNKPLLKPELLAEIASKREAFKADYGKARVKDAAKFWTTCEHNRNRVETKGWEDESQATPMEDILKTSWQRNIGCDKSQAFVDDLWDWSESAVVKTALARWDTDGSLKKFADDLDAKRKKATETIARMTKEVLDQAEKLGPSQGRKSLGFYYTSLLSKYGRESDARKEQAEKQGKAARPKNNSKKKRSKGEDDDESEEEVAVKTLPPFPAGNDTLDRIEKLVNRWNGEDGKAKDADAARAKKHMSDAEEQWPVMVKTLKAGKLDASDALNNPAAWKGRVVVLPGQELAGRTYEAQTYSISEVDGIPVCGDRDPELDQLIKAFSKRTHIKPGYNLLGRIAVVEGTYKVWQRVKEKYTDKMVRGNQIDGVKVRLIGEKWEYCSVAVGVGTSDELGGGSSSGSSDGSSGESSGESSSGSSGGSGGGAVHVIHRFVAWGMCGLLGLVGLLALAHGIARFDKTLEEQVKRLGDGLGYAGCVALVLGGGWFLSALVLPLVMADMRFGSLPSLALVFAGAGLGLDLVRSKGKITPETARKIQPVGILLGLGCLGAAAVHFLFWDAMLL